MDWKKTVAERMTELLGSPEMVAHVSRLVRDHSIQLRARVAGALEVGTAAVRRELALTTAPVDTRETIVAAAAHSALADALIDRAVSGGMPLLDMLEAMACGFCAAKKQATGTVSDVEQQLHHMLHAMGDLRRKGKLDSLNVAVVAAEPGSPSEPKRPCDLN